MSLAQLEFDWSVRFLTPPAGGTPMQQTHAACGVKSELIRGNNTVSNTPYTVTNMNTIHGIIIIRSVGLPEPFNYLGGKEKKDKIYISSAC